MKNRVLAIIVMPIEAKSLEEILYFFENLYGDVQVYTTTSGDIQLCKGEEPNND